MCRGNSARHGSAQADVSAPRMAPDRSETCSLVMMLDAWLCTVWGLTPQRRDPSVATPALSRPRGQQPQDIGLTFGELGKGDYRHSSETVSG
jgi:hypothetical protein